MKNAIKISLVSMFSASVVACAGPTVLSTSPGKTPEKEQLNYSNGETKEVTRFQPVTASPTPTANPTPSPSGEVTVATNVTGNTAVIILGGDIKSFTASAGSKTVTSSSKTAVIQGLPENQTLNLVVVAMLQNGTEQVKTSQFLTGLANGATPSPSPVATATPVPVTAQPTVAYSKTVTQVEGGNVQFNCTRDANLEASVSVRAGAIDLKLIGSKFNGQVTNLFVGNTKIGKFDGTRFVANEAIYPLEPFPSGAPAVQMSIQLLDGRGTLISCGVSR